MEWVRWGGESRVGVDGLEWVGWVWWEWIGWSGWGKVDGCEVGGVEVGLSRREVGLIGLRNFQFRFISTLESQHPAPGA